MGRELSDVFKAKTRVGKRKVLDKFDISKEDKNKFLNGIEDVGTGGDTGENNTQIIGMLPEIIKPRFVDLGLPSGTLWATMNVGATSAEDYGNYYAWGEIEIKSNYNSDNYALNEKNIKK